MIVGFRGMGDAVEDYLAGDSNPSLSYRPPDLSPLAANSLAPAPSWATSSSAEPPASTLRDTSGGSGFLWNDLAKTVTGTVLQTLLGKPSLPTPAPTYSSSSSGISPVLVVGGLAAVGVVGYLLMRRG